MAPPGFCNRGEVRYGSIGGPEYEVPQSQLYCQRGSLLDGLAMYLSCDRKKFHDMKAHTYYIIFGRPPIGGRSFPLGGATDHSYRLLHVCVFIISFLFL